MNGRKSNNVKRCPTCEHRLFCMINDLPALTSGMEFHGCFTKLMIDENNKQPLTYAKIEQLKTLYKEWHVKVEKEKSN